MTDLDRQRLEHLPQPSTAPYHYPASQSLGGINHFRAGLASSQPVRNEFQRYPGHPSTTSLGLALKGLMDSGSSSGKILTSELLYMMTPRLMPGSSQGGTKQLLKYDAQVDPAIYGLTPDPPAFQKKTFDSGNLTVIDPTTGNPVPNPSFHLYSSLDEMYYTTLNKPDTSYPTILKNTVQNNPDGTRVTADKALNLKNVITPAMIDKMRFVLTTHSRSPELNLFGRPRVTIWPIPTKRGEQRLLDTMDFDTKKQGIRNPSDDLFQFCSTVGADPNPPKDPTLTNPNGPIRQGQFIFDRLDPYSSTKDFERTRNRAIFNYLLDVTSNSKGRIPGWGLSFEGKYAGLVGGHIQILTEIFDYIRSVNLKDTSRDQRIDRSQGRKNSGAKKNDNAENLKLEARYAPRGIVVPTRTTVNGANVSGFGRFPTVSEVSLVFYCGGYVYKKRGGDGKPTGPDLVEYDFTKVDERNIITGNAADVFFKNNVLTHKLMRAFLIIETFNPMQGYGPVTALSSANKERIVYEITSDPGFSVTSTSMTAAEPLRLGFGKCNVSLSSGDTWAGRNFGGTEGFFHTMDLKTSTNPGTNTAFVTNHYPFQTPCLVPTEGIRVPIDDTEFKFTGGKMTLTISYKDAPANGNKLPSHDELVQTLKLDWRPGEGWPVPITEREAGRWLGLNGSDWKAKLTTYYGAGKYSGEGFRQTSGGFDKGAPGFNADDTNANFPGHNNEKWSTAFAAHPGYAMAYSLPGRLLWSHRHSWSPWVGVNNTLNNGAGVQVSNGKNYADRFKQIVQPGDTIRSLQPGNDKLPEGTDLRTMHLQKTVEFETFKPHPDYFVEAKSDPNPNISRRAQTLRTASGAFYFPPTDPVWFPNADNDKKKAPTGLLLQLPGGARYLTNSAPDLPRGVTALQQDHTKAADFDTGIGSFPDGAFAGKADEGNVARSWLDEFSIWNYVEPYFTTWAYDSPGDTYFSPNRQIPSPVMFGSLPAPNTSKFDNAGWKTLLFCPNPASRGKSVTEPFNPSIHHHGFKSPPDHLLLDLFNMPVVEPYAISEPFSTDGKVNLNYQLMPFGYIERSTALRAALHPLRVTAIPSNFTRSNAGVEELVYKGVDNDENLRYLVDRDETLKGFKAFFAKFGPGHTETGFFKSGSQICEMFLYPKGRPISKKNTERAAVTFKAGDTDIIQWWKECALTGDNVREKPYSDLYSRVTTKSNTYTVHYRVQSLRQQPYSGNPTSAVANTYYETWDESRDKVLSEYRGHTTIERYLDPRDSRFTFTSTNPAAPAINPETQSLESAYRFRVIYNKRFSPW